MYVLQTFYGINICHEISLIGYRTKVNRSLQSKNIIKRNTMYKYKLKRCSKKNFGVKWNIKIAFMQQIAQAFHQYLIYVRKNTYSTKNKAIKASFETNY